MTRAPEFHAGDLISDYRLEARLGHGGFGTVWRARHVSTGRIAAVKVLPENESILDSASLRADVELLAASAASASPHIVKVFGGGIDPVPHVIMEFINGTSLAEELKNRGKLSQPEVIDIGLGIAQALEALQEVGIVHRDVKPSNVLIDRNGTIKLTDFGIAKIAGYDAVTATGQLPLSIAYAAPEVWEGKAEHRSDLYALGVLLYQCLTGSLPFRGAYAELFYQHRSQAPDLDALPQGTAHSLIDLINVTLRKNPAERPEGAATCRTLLLQAREELNTAGEEEMLVEPARFGPWVKGEPHASQPWAWHARNADTGEDAVVELHFATTADYGETLRKAVSANDQLVPLGAERLIQTNRLILRPGEAWTDPPRGQFQFWVARDEVPLPEQPQQIGPGQLLAYTESLQALISAAEEADIALYISKQSLVLLPDGTVHLKRPGVDLSHDGEPERDALAFLRSQPLSRELRPLLSRSRSLEDLHQNVERLMNMAAAGIANPEAGALSGRRRFMALAGAALSIIVIAAVGISQLGGSDGKEDAPNAVVASPTQAGPTVVPSACDQLALPAPLSAAQTACAGQAVDYRLDISCPPSQACRRDQGVLYVNDSTVAFVGPFGEVERARESGLEPVVLRNTGGTVQAVDWSPDGRFLAYLVSVPAGVQTAANTPAESTQLWLLDSSRPSNYALLLASNNAAGGLERLIASPRWSADGRSILFQWLAPEDNGGSLYSIGVPYTSSGDIDYAKLRTAVPPSDPYVGTTLDVVNLEATTFGPPNSYFGSFTVAPSGAMYFRICQGTGGNRACGIGQWDGVSATMLVPIEPGVVYGLPLASPFDGVLHMPRFQAGAWRLARLDPGGPVVLPGIAFFGSSSATPPQFTFNRSGDALIFETQPGVLSLVGYDGTVLGPWGSGSMPEWYVLPPEGTLLPGPEVAAYATPVPTPTPVATPTPVLLRQMTINVRVVNTLGQPVSGATVSARINGIECATVVTGPGAATMQFPNQNPPAPCRQSGAAITFAVNGQPVLGNLTYQPGAISPIDLLLP